MKKVLIITQSGDYHSGAMQAVIASKFGMDCDIIDIGTFPLLIDSYFHFSNESNTSFSLYSDSLSINPESIQSVWWRRPLPCVIETGKNQIDKSFFEAESNHYIQGVLQTLDCLWVNEPGLNRLASRKIYQLHKAVEYGLDIPETLITNDPDKALNFISHIDGDVIYKRTGTSPGALSKTSLVDETTLVNIKSIKFSPTTFQKYIVSTGDIRVIWINNEIFSVKIDSQNSETPEDSRFDHTVDYSIYHLPKSVENKLSLFMKSLGLIYGAIDFRIGVDKKLYFLEVNPAGQFAYLEVKTGLPIMESLAKVLAIGKTG